MKQVLLINDLCGYGKVATAAMLPVLSYMGISVYNLPTALVSNTLDYGKFTIDETTDYIKNVFPVWKDMGFKFDAIATGFIVSEEQAHIISDFCKEQALGGTQIYMDPIMGDEGKLYNGVGNERINVMKELIKVADLIYPNYTEATFLTNTPYHQNGTTEEEAVALLNKLVALGAKSALITSMKVNGKDCVIGYNADNKEQFIIPFDYVDAHFPGTGDIFSAVLIGSLENGKDLKESTHKAMDAVRQMVLINKGQKDKNRGIPVENCLYIL